VKDTQHLLAKIVRKNVDGVEKYRAMSVANYHEIVGDLVGLRVMHLFKDECFEIGRRVLDIWQCDDDRVAYIREGDDAALRARFESEGYRVAPHKAGYRSVHISIKTSLFKRSVNVELQVRTIFEEGWSEIDHRVRYPDFSDNPLIVYILSVFNRLAGSADEMGAFVNALAAELSTGSLAYEGALKDLSSTAEKLATMEAKNADYQRTIGDLQTKIAKLRTSPIDAFGTPAFAALPGMTGVLPSLFFTEDAKKSLLALGFPAISDYLSSSPIMRMNDIAKAHVDGKRDD